MVIAHGVSEHSDRYAHVGERLASAGYAVHALDHRGHGHSGGRRAVIDRLAHALDDLDALIDAARSRHPGLPLFLLGHSMGGGVALAYAVRRQEKLAGLALSAPLAVLETASPVTRMVARILSAVAPGLGVYQVESSAISTDPEVVRAYDEDPRIHHEKLPARTVAELTGEIGTFPEAIPSLRLPLLVMHGSADRITPPDGSRLVHEWAGSDDKTLIFYEGLYHEILNEPERERVLSDLVRWLDARC